MTIPKTVAKEGDPPSIEAYCWWLACQFYVVGAEREDIYQEAWIAAWLEPRYPELAARRQVYDMIRKANRRSLVPVDDDFLESQPARTSLVDLVDVRAQLRDLIDGL